MIFSFFVSFSFFFFLYMRILKTDQSPIIRGWLFLLSFLRQRRFKVLFENFNLASDNIEEKQLLFYFRFYWRRCSAIRLYIHVHYFPISSFFFFFAYCSLLHPPIPQKNTRILYVNSIIIRSFFFVSKRCRKSHTNFISLSYIFIKKISSSLSISYTEIFIFSREEFFSPQEDFSLNNKLEKKISK